ncbi:MAG: hypothetical protein AAGJ79_00535 [Verrucomicrobiota bacterium]
MRSSSLSFRRSFLLSLFLVCAAAFASHWLQRTPLQAVQALPESRFDVTDSAADELGRSLARAIAESDTQLIQILFDDDAFYRKAMSGQLIPVRSEESFREGLVNGVRKRRGLIFDKVLGGRVRYLGIRDIRDVECPMLRILNEDKTVEFVAVQPVKHAEGDVRAADFFSLQTGEWLSEMIGRASLPTITAMKRTNLESHFAREDDIEQAKDLMAFDEAGRLLGLGEVAEAMKAFERLGQMKEDRSSKILFLRILSAMPEQKRAFDAAVAQFAVEEPLGTSALMMEMNQALRLNELAGKTQVVRDLEDLIGADPFFESLKARVALADGEFLKAHMLAGEVTTADPSLEDAWWTLVGSGLKLRKYKSVADGLETLDSQFAHNFHSDDFKTLSAYRPFLRSEVGLEFVRSLP